MVYYWRLLSLFLVLNIFISASSGYGAATEAKLKSGNSKLVEHPVKDSNYMQAGKTRLKLVVKNKRVYDRRRASVIKKTFQRVAHNLGLWRGLVKGDGLIHLRLNILRNGAIESTRYIGSVQMTPNEKPTPFNFRSPLPKGRGWTWNISARAT